MNAYNKFAKIYDELMEDFDYKAWADYIEDIFKEYGKSPVNILEMACGTGNLTKELAKSNYEITAFDLSQDMLAQADFKLNHYKNVRLLNLDMTNFNLSEKYSAILSICDSMNYIVENKELYDSFKNVYDHLEDGGIFIFDLNSKYKLEKIIGDNIFLEDREDVFYVWENYYDYDHSICDFFLTFFVKDEDNSFIRFNEEHRQRAYSIVEVTDMLKDIGFKDINYYEAFSFKEVGSNTERISFVAIK